MDDQINLSNTQEAGVRSRIERQSTRPSEGKYPEHEKLRARQRESHVLSGFLDMLDERHLIFAHYHTHTEGCLDEDGERDRDKCNLNTQDLYTFGVPTKEQLIGFYLDVDPKKLSAEKDAMYQEIVAQQPEQGAG